MAAVDRGNYVETSALYEAVTPSDTVELTNVSRAIYVGTGGNVVAIRQDGVSVTIPSVPSGTILPIRAKRIASTGTTATGIVALA